MKIVILTNGTRGDIEPLIYLAMGLKASGHEVTVTASDNFKDDVTSAGLLHASMPVNLQEYMNTEEGKIWFEKISRNPFAMMTEMNKMIPRLAGTTLDAYWKASEGADLLITTTGALGDIYIKKALNIPMIEVHLQPLYPTGEFPYPIMESKLKNPNLCRLTYYMVERMLWFMFKKHIKKWQKETFGKIRKFKGGPFAARRRSQELKLEAFSESIVPRPKDWPDHCKICGYFFPPKEEVYTPEGPLADFLNEGPPPVYIGFGSMQVTEKDKLLSAITWLLENTKTRIILSKGWGLFPEKLKSERLITIGNVSHSWLFPRTGGIIHHGGAGTTAAALKSGVPQIIFPQTADQPFWAKRAAALGVAPEPVKMNKLTPESLKKGIEFLQSPDAKKKAAETGKKIKAERGVEEAVRLIESVLADRKGC